MRYQYRILQTGSLPLRPDSCRDHVEHRCTSALVWPEPIEVTPALCRGLLATFDWRSTRGSAAGSRSNYGAGWEGKGGPCAA